MIFFKGEPNDFWGEDCAQYDTNQKAWFDYACDKTIGYVCWKSGKPYSLTFIIIIIIIIFIFQGEPNNLADEDCAALTTGIYLPYTWYDIPCQHIHGYICKKGGKSH